MSAGDNAIFLVFTVASAILLAGDGVIAPISIGFALMIMVYAGGHISGGHYNPAVSLAAAIRGALEWKQLVPYWVSQIIGACIAVLAVIPFADLPSYADEPDSFGAFNPAVGIALGIMKATTWCGVLTIVLTNLVAAAAAAYAYKFIDAE